MSEMYEGGTAFDIFFLGIRDNSILMSNTDIISRSHRVKAIEIQF